MVKKPKIIKMLKRQKSNKPNNPINTTTKRAFFKWLAIFAYISYLILIIMTQLPFIAEHFTSRALIENDVVEYHLTFLSDGRQTHYYVERINQSIPGRIDVYYYPKSNTLRTKVFNIKALTIYCRSMYYDECKEVFGFNPEENSNYYKWFFIEKDHLNVNIDSEFDIETLKFEDAPKPYKVIVDDIQYTEGSDYKFIPEEGIAISNVSAGMTNVDIYFKSTPNNSPVAIIKPSRFWLQVNEPIILNGSSSYDPDLEGWIANYLWDYGDGNYTTQKSITTHNYPEPGVYGIILTVVDNDLNVGHDYFNITVSVTTDLQIREHVSDVILHEDSPTVKLKLRDFEPYSSLPEENYFWYITGEDNSLYSLSGENSTEDRLFITPLLNQFGNDKVLLWLEDINGSKVYQELWINITPVNDPPIIFGIPDITIHYDVPYEFNYLLYISDVDTPLYKLQLNTSDLKHTSISGFNVTYNFPKSMIDQTEYVILTIWDGYGESSDVVAVWITDDWVPNLVTPLPDVFLDEGEVHKNYFDLDDYFMDPDNDTLYYSYGYTHVNVIINNNHTVDFYAPNDWNGEEMTTFRATDPSGALIEDIITVVVRPINDPPKIQNVPNLVVRYGQDYFFDVSPYIYDEDTPNEDLILTTSDPEHIRIDKINHLVLILNYPYRPNIPYTCIVNLTISDGFNSSFQSITIQVKDNNPPVLIKPFQETVLFEDVPKSNVLNFYEYFYDNDSSMQYFKVINNKNVIVEIDVNGSLTLCGAPNWSGKELITFRAIDPELAIAEGIMEVKVIPVNDPPVIYDIPVQRFNKTEKHQLDLRPYLFDVDNNITQLDISLEDCPIDFEIHGTDIIFYATKPLITTATLHVTDGQDESSEKILLEVVGKSKTQQSLFFELLMLVIIILIMVVGILMYIYRSYRGNYEIIELFLIYRNGCMVLHLSTQEIKREEMDADIISGMFTALQDFTRDSFAQGDSQNENWSLKRLEFKNNNILIDRGNFLSIAVVFNGTPGKKLEKQLHSILDELETSYANVLKNWTGELDELKGVKEIIGQYNLINSQELPKRKHKEVMLEQPKIKSH